VAGDAARRAGPTPLTPFPRPTATAAFKYPPLTAGPQTVSRMEGTALQTSRANHGRGIWQAARPRCRLFFGESKDSKQRAGAEAGRAGRCSADGFHASLCSGWCFARSSRGPLETQSDSESRDRILERINCTSRLLLELHLPVCREIRRRHRGSELCFCGARSNRRSSSHRRCLEGRVGPLRPGYEDHGAQRLLKGLARRLAPSERDVPELPYPVVSFNQPL
jgi:hypothetical protein